MESRKVVPSKVPVCRTKPLNPERAALVPSMVKSTLRVTVPKVKVPVPERIPLRRTPKEPAETPKS